MKNHLCLVLVMIISMSLLSHDTIVAAEVVSVTVAGRNIQFDQPPVIKDGRTLVPIRAVCEEIGASVEWVSATKEVIIVKEDQRLVLQVGNSKLIDNNGGSTFLDVPPQIIGDRVLLPIRAVMEVLGYEVLWDGSNNTVVIEESGVVYVPKTKSTQITGITRWAEISSVQQFSYQNEGIAYAYVEDNTLRITTPNKMIDIDMKYPILGDVIADEEGNLYIVWGISNTTDDATYNTVYISKYSPEGIEIKTTGFVGASTPWGDSDAAKTKTPFLAGGCVSVIADGVLVNYHAKQRYDGHQSDNVVAVTISDMKAYELPNNTYAGHSFNQSLIYCEKTSDFLFASHGDAYIRGFRINDRHGKYGDEDENIFHFFLEQNVNSDMFIVNQTFAQLGDMVETSKGVAVIGASAKSISEKAKGERQNLFVQIVDPLVDEISPSKFVGGTTRTGAMSFDYTDNQSKPLTNVTDYGIHWLTDYEDMDVIAPQAVMADDKMVILWSTRSDTYYMVLSASGEVMTPATSLGRLPLNSYERPIYYNGSVYWASVRYNRLKVQSIEIE